MRKSCKFCNNPTYTKSKCEKKVQLTSKEYGVKHIDLTNNTNGPIKSEETKQEKQGESKSN